MRPLYGRKLAMDGEKQRRKSFAGFDLPSTSFDWDDDQIHAYKGARDGLGMDALKAEQYVNTHTPPSKPSGQANLFYKPDAPTAFEQDLYQKLKDRPKPAGMKPDDGPPVQFASQSGHVLGDGEARKPRPATPAISPLFKQTAQLGKQVHNQEQSRKITERNGYRGGARIDEEKPTKPVQEPVQEKRPYSEIRTDPITKKRIVTAKFGDNTFEFNKVFTADEITGGIASIKAKLRSNPHAMGMERIEGVSGEYYINPDDRPEGYRAARDKATSVRFAKDVNTAATYGSLVFPALGTVGTATAGYTYIMEPTKENAENLLLSGFGNKVFPRRWFSEDNAERGSAALQIVKDEYDKRKK